VVFALLVTTPTRAVEEDCICISLVGENTNKGCGRDLFGGIYLVGENTNKGCGRESCR
jgi:hypothetical protein